MEQLINDFSPGLFAMQAFILLVLIFLMRKFAWKPILDSLDSRETDIKEAIETAKQAKAEFKKLTEEKEEMLKEARVEKDTLLKEAQATSAKMIEEAKTAATEEGNKMIEKAKATIEGEKKAAIADMKSQSATLALEIAEKVIKSELSTGKAQNELLNKYLEEVV